MIRAVFFDVDDTLVDYDSAARAAFREALGPAADYDQWLALDHYERFNRGELDFLTMRETRMADFLALLGRGAEVADAAAIEARRFDGLSGRYRLFDDVLPCLTALREQGLLIGLITNNEPTYQRAKIRTVGLDGLVDAVVISGEVGIAKPEPAIFEHACAVLGIDAPTAIHVGDNLDADVRGAIEAGLRGVWINRRGLTAQTHPAAATITCLAELATLLG